MYGVEAKDFTQRGLKISSRTMIECAIDTCAIEGASKARDFIMKYEPKNVVAIDFFLGSGNMLYHLANSIGANTSVGFELNNAVFKNTKSNLELMNINSQIYQGSYETV